MNNKNTSNNLVEEAFAVNVLNSIAIPTFVINQDGFITHWNQAMEKASGYPAERMIGTNQQWKPFYTHERPTMADLIIAGGHNQTIEQFYRDKYRKSSVLDNAYEAEDYFPAMGSGEWLSFTAAPIFDKENNIVGAVETFVVISDRKQTEQELIESQKKYRLLSTVDDLTQLYNSRHFQTQIKHEVGLCNRYQQQLSICLFDLDNFKHLNDTYGHVFGNIVLEAFGKLLNAQIRHIDEAFRFGGEEFIITMPMVNEQEAFAAADRIRTEWEAMRFTTANNEIIHITVSAGVATHTGTEEAQDLINRADKAMYQSKQKGKNQITMASHVQQKVNPND